MALGTPTALGTANATTSSATATTDSVTPTAGAIVYFCTGQVGTTDSAAPSISGTGWASGLTWTSRIFTTDPGNSRAWIFTAVCPGSPSAGTVTATYGASQTGAVAGLFEITGAVEAPVSSGQNRVAGTSISADLGSPSASNTQVAFAFYIGTGTATTGTDYVQIENVDLFSNNGKFVTQYDASAPADGIADLSLSVSGTTNLVTLEVEESGGDVTAPTLSSPTDTSTGSSTGSGSVSTDEGNGTLYWVVTTSATSPSAAQVKAGNDHTGSAAVDSGNQAVSGTGVQNVSGGFTGLTESTTYYAHYMHEDAATNQSSVSSADGFTTDAASGNVVAIMFQLIAAG